MPLPTRTTGKAPRQRKFDHGMALELAIQGWRYRDIAIRCKVSEPAVKQALSKYQHLLNDLQPGALEAYRAKRSDLMTAVERELMCSLIDPARLAKASLNNAAYAYTQVFNSRRLEEGKSTENKSIISAMLDGAHNKLFSEKYVASSQVVDANPVNIMDEPVTD